MILYLKTTNHFNQILSLGGGTAILVFLIFLFQCRHFLSSSKKLQQMTSFNFSLFGGRRLRHLPVVRVR